MWTSVARVLIALLVLASPLIAQNGETVETLESGGHTVNVIHLSGEPYAITKIVIPDGDDWIRDMRVDVKNTTSKPLYLVHFAIVLREMRPRPVGMHLTFGNLTDYPKLETIAVPSAPKIEPGATVTLQVDQRRYEGFLKMAAVEQLHKPTMAEIRFQFASHGDGTGWMLNHYHDWTTSN